MEMAAVVIPVYKNELSMSELISLRQCKRILDRYPMFLIAPKTIDIENNELSDCPVERFPESFFNGIDGYNRLMLSKELYKRFRRYRYILIYQLDAFVFSDRLREFCGMGYDYIGAPWLRGHRYIKGLERRYLYVGNGGFSLRRISAFLEILENELITDVSEPEDVFWASRKGLKIAPVEIAVNFSIETQVKKIFELNHGSLPFGCHAWFNFDFEFLRPYIQKYGYELNGIAYKKMDDEAIGNGRKKDCLDVDRETMLDALKVFAEKEDTWKVAIFGAGRLGDECYKALCFAGIEVVCAIDNDKEKQGKCLWKHKIISPGQFAAMYKTEKMMIIVAVGQRYCGEVMEQCSVLFGTENRILIAYKDLRAEIEKRLNTEREAVIENEIDHLCSRRSFSAS